MSTFIGSPPALNITKVIATRQTPSGAINGVGAGSANLVDTISIPSPAANIAYKFLYKATTTGVVGQAVLLLRFSDGTNNSDVTINITQGTPSTNNCGGVIDIFPTATTKCIEFNTYQGNTSGQNIGAEVTLTAGSTWAAQTSIKVMGYVGTSGSWTLDAYSFQQVQQ